MKRSWVALLCLTLPACIPVSENPLSGAGDSVQDERLIGSWRHQAKNGNLVFLHIGLDPDRPNVGMSTVFLGYTSADKVFGDPSVFDFLATKIAGTGFASVRIENEEHPERSAYLFYKYAVTGNELAVWHMDFENSAKIVEAGKLSGEVKREEDVLKEVRITASTEAIVEYLKAGGVQTLFPEKNKAVYVRIP